jgi:hypothetical protein
MTKKGDNITLPYRFRSKSRVSSDIYLIAILRSSVTGRGSKDFRFSSIRPCERRRRDSADGTVSNPQAGRQRSRLSILGIGDRIFLFFKTSKLVLGPAQPPVHCVAGTLPRE